MARIWGIHNDQPDIDPVVDHAVRIGGDELGDLSHTPPTRAAYRELLAEHHPDMSSGALSIHSGTLYRFIHEIAVGDIVVCPRRRTRTLDIGRVTDSYEYHPEGRVYHNWRPVEWLRTGISRDELSLAGQNEISSAMTLFTITTAAEEILHLLNTAPASVDGDFRWAAFYTELATNLLSYRNNRAVLLEKMWGVAEASARPELFRYLRSDVDTNGSHFRLADIDPFTVFSSFNRGIRDEARADICRAFGAAFEISAEPPTAFSGIPFVNNLASWFFAYSKDRHDNDIDKLWDLCQAVSDYSHEVNEQTREALVSAFDAQASGNTRKITMGIFWMRPLHFAAYDSVNVTYLKDRFPTLAASLSLGSKISGEQFLANTETLSAWLHDPTSPHTSFPELSHAAWVHSLSATSPDQPTETGSVKPPETSAGEAELYDLSSIREDGCFVAEADLVPMLERLQAKKNIVLQGPPGTGKTWLARRLAWALCGQRSSDRVQVLQFHPSLAYEDFVRGWRPSSSGLVLEDGPFLQLCGQAAADPHHTYVLVIEEINRGNPAQIFGELLTLLEADKRSCDYSMRLAYPRDAGERFHIPANLHLIGTMNLADRSLAMVDMALRRRFAFIELAPNFGQDWVQHVSGLGYDLELLEIFATRLSALNDMIATDAGLGPQYCVGHSFFTPAQPMHQLNLDTRQWWQRVIDTDIRPLLGEYWFDRPQLVDEACQRLLGG